MPEPPLQGHASRLHAAWLADPAAAVHRSIEASLVFFDVSGFTRLTERLANRGRVGAEEVTDLIDSVLGAVLGEIAVRGGDVLKFGGDSLLVLFEDPHSAVEATQAAQAALGRFQRLATSVGPVTLRASVGAERGPVDLVLAGTTHSELVVMGPAVDAALALERGAAAGRVCLGRALYAAGRGSSAPVVAMRWRTPPETLPPPIREFVSGGGEPEHRWAAIAFVRLQQPDAASVRDFVSTAQRLAAEHGVTFGGVDVDHGAVKLLLVAGAPTTLGDDEDRVLAACHGLIGTFGDRARAGATSGRVFAGEVGTPWRRTWTVMGDVVNAAARAMAHAEPGTVLAAEDTLDRARTRFARQRLEPIKVKGKRRPMHVAVVGDAIAAGPWHIPSTPLVGRERELETIAAVVRRGGVLEISGEPGIGKSRLLAQALEFEPALRIDATAIAQSSPFLALRGPLRELVGADANDEAGAADALARTVRDDPDLRQWLALLAEPLRVSAPESPVVAALEPEFRPAAIRRHTLRLLTRLLPRGSVLIVEDTHWLDSPSAQLLAEVAAAAPSRGWSLIATRRPETTPLDVGAAARRLELVPLEAAASDELVAAMTHGMSAAERWSLVDRAAGNPLFLTALAHAAAGGQLEDLPESIEGVLTRRIDELPPAKRLRLRHAAVLGTTFPPALLAVMLDSPPESVLNGFVVSDGDRYRFQHDLVRQAAYDGLPFRRRRELHGVLVAALERDEGGVESDERIDLLSFHGALAGAHEVTWRYGREAAVSAASRGAPLEAMTHLERALAAGRALGDRTPEELYAAYVALAEAAQNASVYARAGSALRTAQRYAATPVDLARAFRRRGYLVQNAGSIPAAQRWYARASRTLETVEGADADSLRAELAVDRAAICLQQARPARALTHLDGLDAASGETDAELTHARSSMLRGWALRDLGRPGSGAAIARAIAIAERHGFDGLLGLAYNNQGVDAYFAGDWQKAIASYDRVRLYRERVGDLVDVATALVNIGEIWIDQGRYDEASPILAEARTIFESAGHPLGHGFALCFQGRAALGEARFEAAERLLAESRAVLQRSGQLASLLDAELRDVELLVARGRPGEALAAGVALAPRALEAGANFPSIAERAAGLAHAQLGDTAKATTCLVGALDYARSADIPFEQALTLRALLQACPAAAPADARACSDAIFRELGVIRLSPPLENSPEP